MNTETITKRGIESALYVCPEPVAASNVERARVVSGVVTPFQGTGLPFAGKAAFAMTDVTVAVRSIQQQLVPPTRVTKPGDHPPSS